MLSPLRMSFAFGATGATIDQYVPLGGEGFAHAIKLNIPACAGTPTTTINIYDKDGDLLFTKATLGEGAVTMVYPQVGDSKPTPIMAGAKINLTMTSDPGAVTVTVVLYLLE